ncbi:MAG: hypothetical protein EZS28_019748 [Streblomastix strix]|uniref:Protein kinase domain-containing protein n=1 Tax=Streblomastix strix TaxID=222440 RepID=A0A5J4VR41_9EUKA|nr:MAG: hypothetical protein EZS28_019748 [Streblomastix strix]
MTQKKDFKPLLEGYGYHVLIDHPIGEGQFGQVYKVEDQYGIISAVKVQEEVDYQPGEDESLTRLNGQSLHIIGYFDTEIYQGKFLTRMQFANLNTLHKLTEEKDRVKTYQLSERTVSIIARHIFSALSIVHKNNYIHRDIKLDNLIFHSDDDSDQCRLLLCDFGEAVQGSYTQKYKGGSVSGNCLYWPPEINTFIEKQQTLENFYGELLQDPSMDVYAAGVALFFILADRSQQNKFSYVKGGRFNTTQHAPSLGEAFWNFLERILEPDRTMRIHADQALNHPFITKYAQPQDQLLSLNDYVREFNENPNEGFNPLISQKPLPYQQVPTISNSQSQKEMARLKPDVQRRADQIIQGLIDNLQNVNVEELTNRIDKLANEISGFDENVRRALAIDKGIILILTMIMKKLQKYFTTKQGNGNADPVRQTGRDRQVLMFKEQEVVQLVLRLERIVPFVGLQIIKNADELEVVLLAMAHAQGSIQRPEVIGREMQFQSTRTQFRLNSVTSSSSQPQSFTIPYINKHYLSVFDNIIGTASTDDIIKLVQQQHLLHYLIRITQAVSCSLLARSQVGINENNDEEYEAEYVSNKQEVSNEQVLEMMMRMLINVSYHGLKAKKVTGDGRKDLDSNEHIFYEIFYECGGTDLLIALFVKIDIHIQSLQTRMSTLYQSQSQYGTTQQSQRQMQRTISTGSLTGSNSRVGTQLGNENANSNQLENRSSKLRAIKTQIAVCLCRNFLRTEHPILNFH